METKQTCGCYYCLREFPEDEISSYATATTKIEEAFCPYCGIDSVLPKAVYGNLGILEKIHREMFSICTEDFRLMSEKPKGEKFKESKMDILKWVGIGSSWSMDLCNTSALFYDETKRSAVLVDTGSLVFHKLFKDLVLEEIDELTVLITHLHGDHVGSLVDIVMYMYYTKNIKTKIIFNDENIKDLLELQGLDLKHCEFINGFIDDKERIKNINLGVSGLSLYNVREVEHVETLKSYSYDFFYKDEVYMITGDIKKFPEEILEYEEAGILGEAYVDVSIADYPGVPHLTFEELLENVPKELRHKIFCVHLKGEHEFDKIVNMGFNIPYYI